MKILINPRFLEKLKRFKQNMKPYMVAEFENQLARIEDHPALFNQLGNSKFFRCEIKIDYHVFHVAYEWDKEKESLIFWDIDKE